MCRSARAHPETWGGRLLSTLIPIKTESDVVTIRSMVREIAGGLGFDELDQSRIVSSVSELALNVVHHADEGTVLVEPVNREGRQGIRMVAPGFRSRDGRNGTNPQNVGDSVSGGRTWTSPSQGSDG